MSHQDHLENGSDKLHDRLTAYGQLREWHPEERRGVSDARLKGNRSKSKVCNLLAWITQHTSTDILQTKTIHLVYKMYAIDTLNVSTLAWVGMTRPWHKKTTEVSMRAFSVCQLVLIRQLLLTYTD